MNRQQRRASEARQKMQRNAERLREVVQEGHTIADELDRYKRVLFAHIREHGRIRVRLSELQKLHEHDRLDFLRQENGDVIIQYMSGAAP